MCLSCYTCSFLSSYCKRLKRVNLDNKSLIRCFGVMNLSIAPIGIVRRMIRAIVASQAGQVWSLEVKMALKQTHRQKSFSGDHSKNLKQSNEKSPDT